VFEDQARLLAGHRNLDVLSPGIYGIFEQFPKIEPWPRESLLQIVKKPAPALRIVECPVLFAELLDEAGRVPGWSTETRGFGGAANVMK
jgi:hypothetical protein